MISVTRARPVSHRLGAVLLISFALTISSFIVSTLVLRARATGIGASAESIALNAAPCIAHLSMLRTGLRRMEVTLDDFTDRVASGRRPDGEPAELDADRLMLRREWTAYAALPTYPGERELWPATRAGWDQVTGMVDRILARLAARDGHGAEELLNQDAKPAIAALDERLNAIEELNARQAAELGQRILSIRSSVRDLSNILDISCAIFAVLAAIAAVRLVRRYQRLMEQRLSDLDSFASRVAHDLRSPLAAIGIALELLAREPGEAKARTLVARATRTLARVGQLVDGLLLFARAGATPAEGAAADVKEVVEGVIEQLAPAAKEKEVELVVEPCDGRASAACSAGVLSSITSNLVENAIKYMGEAPLRRITVRASTCRGRLRLEVQDTGAGIAPELQARVFDPYVRLGQPETPGLGLGLATVRRLVEGHGGAVGLQSSSGAGSLFWIELPLASSERAAAVTGVSGPVMVRR
jgi:signal transduction histidine kinase